MEFLIFFNIPISSVGALDYIKAVNVVARPRGHHIVRIDITDFAGRDMTVVVTAHPPPVIRSESFDTLSSLSHVFIIATSNGGLATLRLASFLKSISTEHTAIMEETVEMSATKSNVVRLRSSTGDTVQIKGIAFVGNQWRRHVVRTLVASSVESSITAAAFGSWIRRRWQPEVPLSNLAVF
jgi:hypothetical protein